MEGGVKGRVRGYASSSHPSRHMPLILPHTVNQISGCHGFFPHVFLHNLNTSDHSPFIYTLLLVPSHLTS